MRPQIENQSSSNLVTADEVSAAIQVSRRTVTNLVKRRVIPVIRIGKRICRFDLAAVREALRKFEQEAVQ